MVARSYRVPSWRPFHLKITLAMGTFELFYCTRNLGREKREADSITDSSLPEKLGLTRALRLSKQGLKLQKIRKEIEVRMAECHRLYWYTRYWYTRVPSRR